ncbi:MBOAT family protein [Desulfovibrio sp. JC010]|uniref:MBOAT family O-acyltransferase n=1 Tax=Desulfovibrio sp. JC010 TaxID=2593641 RepID=UPI0013D7AC55|nr:MBOAT family protein [Desulfovibrio sp. JC010]NDV27862.1 MBOAT family protein [Desulfovibrio sp. JC010]
MLFNSFEFLFIFFPSVLLSFFITARLTAGSSYYRLPYVILFAASTIFYACWDYHYLWLIFMSVVVNFIFGKVMCNEENKAKPLLVAALLFNLSLLGYYKYTDFFISNFNLLTGANFNLQHIILPLGISFFTFTQIAFLVDIYRNDIKEFNFLDYATTITFFPHLVAGPILFHHLMMPQLQKKIRFKLEELVGGITIFCVGLGKKVLLADPLGAYADPIFNGVALGFMPDAGQSWRGALCYSLQLYYDFSGYSDMAIGLALCLGIRIPLNFYSPYKAVNIADFWRRWHVSLGVFLRNYLYIPLGGNRNGFFRKCINLFIVMLLCGIWHGAGWTFVVWGVLHGVYMVINTMWMRWKKDAQFIPKSLRHVSACFFTFLCVVVGWVVFRADTLDSAWVMLNAMLGNCVKTLEGVSGTGSELYIVAGLLVAWFLPNVQQLFLSINPSDNSYTDKNVTSIMQRFVWKKNSPAVSWAVFAGAVFFIAVSRIATSTSETFLYFQF